MRIDLAAKVTQAYFDHAYNVVYDFITAPLTMYGKLQQNCIGKLGPADNDRILCVGLGTGNEIVRIMHANSNVFITGVDYSATALRNARRKTFGHDGQVELLLMDARRLEFGDGAFDKVLCIHVMDFIRDNETATNEIVRVLKEGGQFVITYPSEGEGRRLALNVLKDTYYGTWISRNHFLSLLKFLARLLTGLVYLPLLFRPKPKAYSPEQLGTLFAGLTKGALEIEEYAVYQDFIVHGKKTTKGYDRMLNEDKYFKDMTKAELWQRYCGFLDLSIQEFMELQRDLLMDQIERVANSTLGKKIMRDGKPKSVEEFRRTVPITTYADYEPYLSERRDDALADKPVFWAHSSGVGGKFKWIPYTKEGIDASITSFISMLILGSARRKGEVNISLGERMLMLLPPPPYVSGSAVQYMDKYGFTSRIIPPLEEAVKMEFPDRIARGFRIALGTGVDAIFSITSVLVKVGEEMASHARRTRFSLSLLHPSTLSRMSKAWLRSRIGNRAMLPRDLWQPKAILTLGVDTEIYRADVVHYWGQVPYEIYGGTEVFPIAVNAWNKKWLTFEPRGAFYEFIPEEEQEKAKNDPGYKPKTVLLNEVEVGKSYEMVITQFWGMPLLRYQLGDVVTITGLSDKDAGINLPQMKFKCRTDEMIHLAGLAKLDEKTLWQAIVNTGVKYQEWTAQKEFHQGQAYLHFYVEPKESSDAQELGKLIDAQLKAIDPDYRDIGAQLGLQPVKVTFLSVGTFNRYLEERRREGADPAHMKPRHVNVSDDVVQRLMRLSSSVPGRGS